MTYTPPTIESIAECLRVSWHTAHLADQRQRFNLLQQKINGIQDFLIHHDLTTYKILESDLRMLWSVALHLSLRSSW